MLPETSQFSSSRVALCPLYWAAVLYNKSTGKTDNVPLPFRFLYELLMSLAEEHNLLSMITLDPIHGKA
eukprot:103820-Lingulodinium_polyedra.AAC.1